MILYASNHVISLDWRRKGVAMYMLKELNFKMFKEFPVILEIDKLREPPSDVIYDPNLLTGDGETIIGSGTNWDEIILAPGDVVYLRQSNKAEGNPVEKYPDDDGFKYFRVKVKSRVETKKRGTPLRFAQLTGNPDLDCIIRLRRRLEVSQGELASMLGLSYMAVGGWERGNWKPSGSSRKLLEELDAKTSEIFEKFKVALHCLINFGQEYGWNMDTKALINAVVMADVNALLFLGKIITGTKLVKAPGGPVPKGFTQAIRELIEEGKIEAKENLDSEAVGYYQALEVPCEYKLTDDELHLLYKLGGAYGDKNHSRCYSALKNNEVWEKAALGDVIPHEAYIPEDRRSKIKKLDT